MLIADSQVHIWGADTPERPWPKRQGPHRPNPLGADELLAAMNEGGVDRVVLVPPGWEGERNDLALAAASRHPDRFAVMGRIDMEVYDPRDLRQGGKGGSAHGPQQIAAPMPGKVVRILVAPGDTVEAGQGVVVVEAMKMQNEMKSPKAGTVREVRTRTDATVTAGEILLVIE